MIQVGVCGSPLLREHRKELSLYFRAQTVRSRMLHHAPEELVMSVLLFQPVPARIARRPPRWIHGKLLPTP